MVVYRADSPPPPVHGILEIRMTIGERTEETNLKLFGEERCARADGFWKLVEHYQDNVYKDMETVYEGVPELLDSLHQKGYRTAVCSNADRTYIEMMLGRLADTLLYVEKE